MYYTVDITKRDHKLPVVTEFKKNGSKDPYSEYMKGIFDPAKIHGEISGSNNRAKFYSPGIIIKLFPLNTEVTWRTPHIMVTIPQKDVDQVLFVKQHPSVKLRIAVTGEIPSILDATPGILTRLWKASPYTLFGTLVALEEIYSKRPEVAHTPFMRDYAILQKITSELRTWKEFVQKYPNMF